MPLPGTPRPRRTVTTYLLETRIWWAFFYDTSYSEFMYQILKPISRLCSTEAELTSLRNRWLKQDVEVFHRRINNLTKEKL